MKKAIYYAPGVSPKTYDCQHGATPGTVDLLNDAGRVIVSCLPVKPAAEIPTTKACAVLVEEVAEKVAKVKTVKEKVSSADRQRASSPEADNDGDALVSPRSAGDID
jgi:hypothetical protein